MVRIWVVYGEGKARDVAANDPLADDAAKPPSDPRIQVANEDWTPDEELLARLGPPVQVGGIELRLPRSMRASAERKLGTDHFFHRWRERKCVAAVLQILPPDNWTASRIERDLLTVNNRRPAGSPREENLTVVRGRLNGRVCYRSTSNARDAACGQVFKCEYTFPDSRGRSIGITFATTERPGSAEYRLLETAARTIRED